MTYTSPFHVLKNKDTQIEDTGGLKKLKKELLLEFDLQQTTTIKLNGKEYDKASINALFDELKENHDFHLKVFKNKDLLRLLEKGDLQLFQGENDWTCFGEVEFKDWLAPYFIKKTSDLVLFYVEHEGENSIKKLELISGSGLPLLSETKEQVFAKGSDYLNQKIEVAKKRTALPFSDKSRYTFRTEIKEVFTQHLFNILRVLPEILFQPIIKKFAFVGRQLLNKAAQRDSFLKEYKKDELQTLLIISEICLLDTPDDSAVREFHDVIHSRLRAIRRKEAIKPFLYLFLIINTTAVGWGLYYVVLVMFNVGSHLSSPPKYYLAEDPTWKGKEGLIGEWSAMINLEGQNEEILRTVVFVNEKRGYDEWGIMAGEEEVCSFVKSFNWDIKYDGPRKPRSKSDYTFYIEFLYDDDFSFGHNCDSVLSETNLFMGIEKKLTGRAASDLEIYSLEQDPMTHRVLLNLSKEKYFPKQQ